MGATFRPSEAWLSNWPWQQSTIVRLQAECAGGQKARQAAQTFMDSLSYQSDHGVACEGGYCVKMIDSNQTDITSLEFYSAGEDGFSSLLFGVEDFEAFVAGESEITGLTWRELEPKKSTVK